MAVNYATNYEQAIQELYRNGLHFFDLYNTPNNASVKWTGAKTIQVPSITVGGFTDVDRDVMGSFTRRVDNEYVPYTLEHDREFRTLVDPVDIDETNMALSISNITRVFNKEHKVPEMDKYMASKLFAEKNAIGAVGDSTFDTANVLDQFDTFMTNMDEAEVPQEGRILYVTPAMYTLLKNAEKIQKTLEVRDGGTNINRAIHSLEDVKVVRVPSSRMRTAYNFTDGAVPDVGSKVVQMMLIHPSCLYAPQKYEFVSVDEPSAKTGGKHLYYERKYWDVFLIEAKHEGCQMITGTIGAGGTGE